jgi:glyoxylase-like metal-dependent hydrolase (beta-lactamase superfamily II)
MDRQDETAKYFLKQELQIPNLVKIDKDLDKIKEIHFGESKLRVIKTPGHTPGSVSLYSKKDNLLFSGDTLFKDVRGRTDFKYGSTKKIYESLRKLMELPEETEVIPVMVIDNDRREKKDMYLINYSEVFYGFVEVIDMILFNTFE